MKSRILHTMIRISNPDESIQFYSNFGLSVLRTFVAPDDSFELYFMGYEDEKKETVIELTWNKGTESYQQGNAFGHLAFAVENCSGMVDQLESLGVEVTRRAGPLAGSDEIIAFVLDPDGYKIELIERGRDWF